jgi:uncharacterized protein (TIGR03435 family)
MTLSPAASGQSVRSEFDVASVRESRSLAAGGTLRFMPDGGIQAQAIPVGTLIRVAFDLQPYQVQGAPDWSREIRYDVQAKPGQPVAREQTRVMLQALLIDRFRLVFHRERRELDGFRMVRSSQDRLGPNIKPSRFDCEKMAMIEPACRVSGITLDSMKVVGSPIWSLLQEAIAVVGAPVADETGLAGTYDFELRWSQESAPSDDRPSFFTALQEQLGLRLERRRVTDEVFVVDRVERASQN